MARATLVTSGPTALQSEPNYDGTEDISPNWADGTWGRPNLSDFPEVGEEETWDDLDAGERADIADAFIVGTADAENYSDLGYPVVNPQTGNLNRNGVRAALSRAAAEDDNEVESIAQDLWDEHFAEDGEESADTEIHLSTSGPTVITRTETSSTSSAPESRSVPDELLELRSRAQRGQRVPAQFETRRTRALDATDARLETINAQHSEVELQPDDVELFRDFAVHNLGPESGMRRPLQFTRTALQKLGQDFERGRTMNVHHNGERQVGTTFGAEVLRSREVRGVEADWLAVDWYAPTLNASEQRMQDIADMQTGVLRYTSIEFAGGDWQEETLDTADGKDFFFRIDTQGEGTFRDELEAEGIARVSLGAVRGAGSS